MKKELLIIVDTDPTECGSCFGLYGNKMCPWTWHDCSTRMRGKECLAAEEKAIHFFEGERL